MSTRHEIREKIVFALYQHLLLHKDINECFSDNFEDTDEFAEQIRNDLVNNKESYIEEISKYLSGWKLSRISKVNHAILLLSFYEIKNIDEIPYSVSINEAVELAKKYSGKEDAAFINGVLGSYVRSFE